MEVIVLCFLRRIFLKQRDRIENVHDGLTHWHYFQLLARFRCTNSQASKSMEFSRHCERTIVRSSVTKTIIFYVLRTCFSTSFSTRYTLNGTCRHIDRHMLPTDTTHQTQLLNMNTSNAQNTYCQLHFAVKKIPPSMSMAVLQIFYNR